MSHRNEWVEELKNWNVHIFISFSLFFVEIKIQDTNKNCLKLRPIFTFLNSISVWVHHNPLYQISCFYLNYCARYSAYVEITIRTDRRDVENPIFGFVTSFKVKKQSKIWCREFLILTNFHRLLYFVSNTVHLPPVNLKTQNKPKNCMGSTYWNGNFSILFFLLYFNTFYVIMLT